jgi:hypothetical protein
VTEYSDSSGPADSPADDGTSPGAANDTDAGALAAEDQLPARQEPDAAIGGDGLEYEYDEDGLAAEYDGDLAALTAEDRLPARQEARAAEGDDPEGDEAGFDLTAEEDKDDKDAGALAAEDRLPARQEPDAAVGGDDPGYEYDEGDLAAEYDGDLEALTAEDRSRDAAGERAPGSPPGENGALDGSGDDDNAAERPDRDGEDSGAQPHVTHYRANVRGEQLDLWTDGQGHWASEYKRADDALPVDHLAGVRSRMGTEATPAAAWVDGHEITVTRDPKDGVWIPGLPGEVPDEAGDVLAGSESPEEKRSRNRDILAEANRESENLLDAIKENSNLTYEALHRPPEGKAEVPVPAHGPVLESTPHETEIGGMVSGAFALGIGLWMLGEKLREQFTRGKAGAGHASDG